MLHHHLDYVRIVSEYRVAIITQLGPVRLSSPQLVSIRLGSVRLNSSHLTSPHLSKAQLSKRASQSAIKRNETRRSEAWRDCVARLIARSSDIVCHIARFACMSHYTPHHHHTTPHHHRTVLTAFCVKCEQITTLASSSYNVLYWIKLACISAKFDRCGTAEQCEKVHN